MMFRNTRAAFVAALLAAALLPALVTTQARATDVDVEAYVKRDLFTDIRISPDGDYFAATLPFEDRVALVIMTRVDKKVTGTFQLGRDTAVADFHWVSPERVLIAAAQKFGFPADGAGIERLALGLRDLRQDAAKEREQRRCDQHAPQRPKVERHRDHEEHGPGDRTAAGCREQAGAGERPEPQRCGEVSEHPARNDRHSQCSPHRDQTGEPSCQASGP